jgi:exodeoxyribonuclease-3
MRLISWNVNGLRAVLKKDFLGFVDRANADVLCLQEIKARPDQVAEVVWPEGYEIHWNPADKPGYSGTAIFTKILPLSVTTGIGLPEHDTEGRVLTLEFDDFHLVNVYTPNSKRGLLRLDYRTTAWEPAFRAYLQRLDATKPVIVCGDLNVAHREIDITNPRANVKNAGFTPEERACLDDLLAAGFLDTFRALHPDAAQRYTWWSYLGQSRARNIGWRIDYFLISERLHPRLEAATIHPDILGSDHCPVAIDLRN